MNATITLTDDEQFFYENAGYSYDPAETEEHGRAAGAIRLAAAYRAFQASDAWINWELDPDADNNPGEDYFVSGFPQWQAVMYRETAGTYPRIEILASLGGIDLGETGMRSPYVKVIVAELAQEAGFR